MNKLSCFQSFCALLMCDDPSQLSPDKRTELETWANDEAKQFGFSDWVEAYHFSDGENLPNETVIHVNPPSADEVAQEICRCINDGPKVAIPDGAPQLTIENLNTLACAYAKRGDKLLEIRDRVKASINIQQDLVAEISRLMEGGDA